MHGKYFVLLWNGIWKYIHSMNLWMYWIMHIRLTAGLRIMRWNWEMPGNMRKEWSFARKYWKCLTGRKRMTVVLGAVSANPFFERERLQKHMSIMKSGWQKIRKT